MRTTATHRARRAFVVLGVLVPCLTACPPQTQMGNISPAELHGEQLRQQQLVITSALKEQQRLSDVAWPMLTAGVPICGKWVAIQSGAIVTALPDFGRIAQEAARSLGYDDTLTVDIVARGSAADRAGLKAGDHIISLGGIAAPTGKGASLRFKRQTNHGPGKDGTLAVGASPIPLIVARRDSAGATPRTLDLTITPDTTCAYGAVSVKNEALNAWANGSLVFVTTAMARFAASDDELAVVVSHELAHNAMRHMDRKKKNATLGALLGAALDVAAATQGVNTGGGFANSGANVGAASYSQDFEREADYVGMYILARAGRPYAESPNFWRRMAQESPGSISYASSHPTSAERFIRLDRAAAEIKAKLDAGKPLLPEATVPGTAPDSAKAPGGR